MYVQNLSYFEQIRPVKAMCVFLLRHIEECADKDWSLQNVRNEQDVDRLLSSNPPNGATPMGSSMRDKILQPLVVARAQQSQLPKPALIIVLTDGAANDRGQDVIQYVIRQAKDALARTRYTENALSLSFAQVGDDQYALEFLDALDKDPDVGEMIDVRCRSLDLCMYM